MKLQRIPLTVWLFSVPIVAISMACVDMNDQSFNALSNKVEAVLPYAESIAVAFIIDRSPSMDSLFIAPYTLTDVEPVKQHILRNGGALSLNFVTRDSDRPGVALYCDRPVFPNGASVKNIDNILAKASAQKRLSDSLSPVLDAYAAERSRIARKFQRDGTELFDRQSKIDARGSDIHGALNRAITFLHTQRAIAKKAIILVSDGQHYSATPVPLFPNTDSLCVLLVHGANELKGEWANRFDITRVVDLDGAFRILGIRPIVEAEMIHDTLMAGDDHESD